MEQPDSMELKVISCKDLKAFNFFQKLNIYVVVSIVNEDDDDDSTPSPTKTKTKKKQQQQQQKQKTPIDREGDGNPEWNYVMRFDLKDILCSSSSFLLEFDLLSEGTILGDKTIGRVRVPFEDIINEFNGGAVRFVSYQVRTTDGIPNGVLDFSFKPIYIHNPTTSSSNHHSHSFVDDNNKFGNEAEAAAAAPLPIGNNNNTNIDVPLIYHRPMPSTNYYPPLLPVDVDVDNVDGSYINNPSPVESYYPRIDQFQNPSQEEIHYPTLEEIHSPPSEFHNPSSPPEVYYPQPQVDYHQLPPSSPYHHHHHPQLAYYPPPTPASFYPPGPPTTDPYVHDQFGRGNPNPIAYGYPNYWPSTPPIHW